MLERSDLENSLDPERGEFLPGEVLDGVYQIEYELGRGNMGSVWAAIDLSRRERVAIKIMKSHMADERDFARFEREALLASKVGRHGGIVQVFAVGWVGGHPYCVMEFVEGQTLKEVLRTGVSTEQLCVLLQEVARALSRCHQEGVVHRDIKPDNIMIGKDGRPKLADFGLARTLSRTDRLTLTGEVVGTPAYMAPEQALDGARAVDPRVDVYGLGAVLYEGLTGRPPFVGSSLMMVLDNVINTPPERPSSISKDVPPALERICLKALEKSPDDRYPTADAMADDLGRVLRGEVAHAPGSSSRGPVALALVALVSLFLGGFAIVKDQRAKGSRALERFRAYDGQDCTHANSGCPPGEHVLVRFALGLGDESARPRAEDLAAHTARLTEANAEGAESEVEVALLRIRALQSIIGEADLPPSGGTRELVAALRASKENEHARARVHWQRAFEGGELPRSASRVWAKVWKPTRWTRKLAGECLNRQPADPDPRILVGAATAWFEESLQKAIESGDSTDLHEARAELAGLTPPGVLREARRASLANTKGAWSTALEPSGAIASSERNRLMNLMECLGTAIREPEPLTATAVHEAIQAIIEQVSYRPSKSEIIEGEVASSDSEREKRERARQAREEKKKAYIASGNHALLTESAAFYAWGFRPARDERSENYFRFLDERSNNDPESKFHAGDFVLAVVRHGVRDEDGELTDVRALLEKTYSSEVDRFLRETRPTSRAFLFLHFVWEAEVKERTNYEGLYARTSLLDPGLIDDLPPANVAVLFEERCDLLEDWQKSLKGKGQRAERNRLWALLRDDAKQALHYAETLYIIDEAYEHLLSALDALGQKRELTSLLAQAVTRFEARLGRARDTELYSKELGAMGGLLRDFEDEVGFGKPIAPEDFVVALRKVVDLADRLEESDKARLRAAVDLSRFLRGMDQVEEAQSIIDPLFERSLADEEVCKEAVMLAIESNDKKLWRERYDAIRDVHSRKKNRWVRDLDKLIRHAEKDRRKRKKKKKKKE